MAITVSYDGNILSGAESESDNGEWNLYNTKNSPTQETDLVFQNQYAISTKVSATTGGIEFEDDATVDLTTPYVVFAKIMCATPGGIDTSVAEGLTYIIGHGVDPDDCYRYYLAGLYAGDYPILKSWLFVAIDPNEIAFRDAITGTPNLAIADYYGLYIDMASSAKSQNIIHDRLDYLAYGDGLTVVDSGLGGTSTFQDFLDDDFNTEADRYGIITPGEAELIVNGFLNIGSATTEVKFLDSNKIIIFPHQRVGVGFFGMKYNLSQATTDIDVEATTFKSLGNASTKMFFDTALEIDDAGTPDTVTIAGGHGLSTGDYVLYSKEGGSDTTGLTDATYYFVRAVSSTTLAFYAVGATVGRQNAFTNTSPISLTTATAPGENHSIIRAPDTRADHTATGTSGDLYLDRCSLDGARVITFTSACEMNGGFILRAGNVVLSTGTADGVSILCDTLEEGDALFDPLTTLSNVKNCIITAGDEGHFARLTSVGGASLGNTFTGFWSPAAGGWNFHTQTGVDANHITTNAAHGLATGDAVYYNNEGGTDTVGLTNGNKYYVNVDSTTVFSVHATKAAAVADSSPITLSDGSSGETHSMYSSKATVFNDSGGAITITVSSGDNPSVRNGTGASTTIAVSKNVNVHVGNVAGADLEDATVSIFRATKTAYTSDSGNTAGDGDFVVNETVDSDQAQQGWINAWRKSDNANVSFRYASWTAKTFTLPTEITGTADTGGSGTILKRKTGTSFLTADIEVGDAIRNTTDGSWSMVDQIIDADTIYTLPLRDGTDDTWEEDDAYSLHRLPITFVDNNDRVDLPLFVGQTDGSGDMATYSHNYSAGPMAIKVKVRHRDAATKYKPRTYSGTIGVNGYTLDATLLVEPVT